jgi:hypothetical protein
MTTFTDLSGATGADAPFTETVATALDRNLFAALEGDSTAISAGARFLTPAYADGAISPRTMKGSVAGSAVVFDYFEIQGNRTLNSSSTDQTTKSNYMVKTGSLAVELIAKPVSMVAGCSFKTQLLVDDVVVAETPAASGTTQQTWSGSITINAGSEYKIKSTYVGGSSGSNNNHQCKATFKTASLFNDNKKVVSWGFDYGGSGEHYGVAFKLS